MRYNSLAVLKPLRAVLMVIGFAALAVRLIDLDLGSANRFLTMEWVNIHIRNFLIVEALYWCAKYRQLKGSLK
jgi:hypothetical protein